MSQFTRRILFLLFFLSGLSGLVYQVVWTRMAFASFGIITPVLSVVISVFMLGLSVGAWAGGKWIDALTRRTGWSAVYFYGLAEMVIGLGAFAVPGLFALGERILLAAGAADSFQYLLFSALVLAISILPWCVCMGATYPLMMAYVREQDREQAEGFSFLYLANVLGAMAGVFLTAVVLVEILGFRHTLWVAAAGNFTIAIISACLGRQSRAPAVASAKTITPAAAAAPSSANPRGSMTRTILFSTGFVAMAMEVVWTRAFTPTLKTQVYSFALIVFTYLGATCFGSLMYRRGLRKKRVLSTGFLLAALAITALLPVLVNDPRVVVSNYRAYTLNGLGALVLMASLCPFCALLGYLTPGLIDQHAAGNPARAGRLYAINVLGCILGPLFACYLLLPQMSERQSLILLSLPLVALSFIPGGFRSAGWRLASSCATGLLLAWCLFFSQDFEGRLLKTEKHTVVRRDYAASVISFGEGMDKHLLVNGVGMTILTPITKFMVHLPLAFHRDPPQSALIICFGMGTTYRSALSWNIDTTAVELVPSVPQAFGFYHADAARVAENPRGTVIIDDGRRYLRRTSKKFDVIVIDPPPPAEAAGSSLLYSREFYALARQHLNPGGILQAWFPGGEPVTQDAVIRSVHESFPYVRWFPSVKSFGIHMLASDEPIARFDAGQLAAHLPEAAKQDLLEWDPSHEASEYLGFVLPREYDIAKLLNPNPAIQVTDDLPYNEYFLLRRLHP